MASSSDIRDIMNLGQAGPRQPAPKKKKHNEPQVRMTGINREIQALMGDSVPPIAIVDHPQYKSRPSLARSFVPRHWEERNFKHGGRTDGLVLKHWKRAIAGSNRPPVAAPDVDVPMTDDTSKQVPVPPEHQYEDEYPSHKWNVAVNIPSYNDDQYDALLKSDDWSRQESDYLMDLCRAFDLRWLLIADRYDEKAINHTSVSLQEGDQPGPETIAQPPYPPRTMEALKSRYYGIAAKMLEIQTPASNMTQAEFQLWEKMRNFDIKTETLRKSMAEKLFERTKDEADEERILLEELHRITKNEDDFIKARKELYTRLEPVLPIRRTERGEEQSTAMYQTSAGLSLLLQSLLAKEKRMKRPAVPGSADSAAATSTPTEPKQEKNKQANHSSRRDTTDTQAEDATPVPQKKGSAASTVPNIRILTPQEEGRFGVSRPQERLTSGVQFRHEKINRLTMAKSQTQTTKIQAALTELGIPSRLLMPTERVCREFERLTTEINILLDARKVNEKLGSEIKVLEEARRIRLGLPKDGDQQAAATTAATAATAAAPDAAPATAPKAEPMDVDPSQVNQESGGVTTETAPTAESTQEAKATNREGQKGKTPEVAEGKAGSTKDRQPTPKAETSKMEIDEDEAGAADDAEGEDDEEVDASSSRKKSDADSDNDDEEDEEEQEDSGVANDSENNQDDDEDEEDEQEDSQVQVEEEEDEDEDDEEDDGNQLGVDEDEDEEQEEDEEEEEDEDEDADSDPAVVAETPEEEDEDQDEEDAEVEAEDDEDEDEDGEEEEADDAATPASGKVEQEDDDEEGEEEEEDEEEEEEEEEEEAEAEVIEPPAPISSTHLSATPGRGHKRSASVLSSASKAGSNRSGLGRKKRR